MKVIISGADGFVGRHLTERLLMLGHEVVAISRNTSRYRQDKTPSVMVIGWDSQQIREEIRDAGAVVNLAGESIFGRRWTRSKKARILNSRLIAGQKLRDALVHQQHKDMVYIQASAIGFYGNAGEKICSELSDQGKGFLARVCGKWESYVPDIERDGVRTLILRIGVVLGEGGGFLHEMSRQSRHHLAGKLGNGRQWLSWIHMHDLVEAIIFLINSANASGTLNLVAPKPVRQKIFLRALSKHNGRNLQLFAPAWAIKLLLGSMGKELILWGQNVSSKKIALMGFRFRFGEIDAALEDLLSPE